MKKFFFSLIVCLLGVAEIHAQRTVSGKVTDDVGEGLPGVNVVIKGTTNGTTTDIDGNYRIEVEENAILIFSFVGFETQEINIGGRTTVDVTMGGAVELDEVVVTAIGIERESRKLGYGVSSIGSDELTVAREANVASSLQGKITGVQIVPQSGNLGGSVAIRVRGVTSLSGRNSPLWVIDGIPISDGNASAGGTLPGGAGGISGGVDSYNTAGVINPDDIESISVLKGASATALYGSRAAAGVIVVTTKKGKSSGGSGVNVSINSSLRFDQLFKAPDFQNSYSAGDLAKYDSSATFNNWGARIVGQEVTNAITGEREALRAYPDNYKDFYETGRTLINNIAVSSADENSDYRLSLTSLNQEGILPAASLDRITASLNAGRIHSDKLSTRFGITYVRTLINGGGAAGANDPNILGWTQFVRTVDFNDYSQWIDESGNQINTLPQSNNPLWIMNENKFEREDDRFFGNFQFDYTPIENLTITGRTGLDLNTDDTFRSNRVGTVGAAQGDFIEVTRQRRQLDLNVYARYETLLGSDFELSLLAGYNYNKRTFESAGNFGDRLAVVNLFAPGNVSSNTPNKDFNEQILMGIFGEAELSYRDYLTLTLTGRNDYSSTLPLDNNSYFYPSVSTSFIFTNAFGIANDVLSYGKLRASYAQVGNDTDPYQLNFIFNPQANVFGQFGTNITFPFQGAFAFAKTNTVPPNNLLPESQNTFEIGTELQLFDGRIGIDAAYFNTRTEDQILAVPIPESTGFTARRINAGETKTTGLEISLNADVLQGNVLWNTAFNFTSTQFEIVELVDGIERLNIGEGFNSVQVVAEPGTSFEIRTSDYLRDSVSGRPIIDPETGLRSAGLEKSWGDIFPDFTLGWVNSIGYKGFNLRFTVDWRQGGVFRSGTISGLRDAGAVEETIRNREGTFIDLAGVLDNGDGTFRDNDVPVRSARDFWTNLNNNNVSADAVFESTFVKLREVAITYTFPAAIMDKLPFKSAAIGVEGRNLALLYTKVPHVDPEAGSLLGAGSDAFGIERNAVPTTRSIGFNLRLGL